MARHHMGVILIGMMLTWLLGCAPNGGRLVVICPQDATGVEVLAAREVQRYVYLRTGTLARIMEDPSEAGRGTDRIVVAGKDREVVRRLTANYQRLPEVALLEAEHYLLKTIDENGRRTLLVTGGDPVGTLYGAYRCCEHLGVRYYLHGDVVPDEAVSPGLPELNERAAPLFELRGIQPFHDFPEGPDFWSVDGYKAVISQLPKLRMNFIGFHTYPQGGGGGAEPMVWIGLPEDIGREGRVKFSYPSWHFSNMHGTWGYESKVTSDYSFGCSQLFEKDVICQDVQSGACPKPVTLEQCNELFNRFAGKLRAAFEHARGLGVKTCIGTEVPLTVPSEVGDRMDVPRSPVEPIGGRRIGSPSPIAQTTDDALYQVQRRNASGYRLTVSNGRYTVALRFAEVVHHAVGKRIFGIKIQDKQVVDKLDIFASAGRNKAFTQTFEGIEVTDGVLRIDFVKQVDCSCIAAIEVNNMNGDGPSLKVNCGGWAYRDYLADEWKPLQPAHWERLYEGIFLRIMRMHPLDYYWFWTPENWTWQSMPEAAVEATLDNIRHAIASAKKVNAPFQLATCGWVLGPQYDRSLFDKVLPKEIALSCISRAVGHDPVEPGFAKTIGRDKWAIPWLEDDPAMISPQLWVGRMRKDAVDALDYGCTGLMGIHWRTRILGPNVSALARAAWDQGASWREPTTRLTGLKRGEIAAFPDKPIAKTEDDTLYQTVRYGLTGYGLAAANATYTVKLRFCESVYSEKGKRVFGVKIQGKQVIHDLDIFAKVGQNTALDYTFKDIKVTNGRLDIEFVRDVRHPLIAAIELDSRFSHRKINCGGPAYRNYEADSDPAPATGRYLASDDFYRDWAWHLFGPEAAEQIGELFARIDGHLPRPSTWVHGPGGIKPDPQPWKKSQRDYTFVEDLAALRPAVKGAGNLERFDYWLNHFRFMKANAHVNCLWAEYNKAMAKVEAAKDADKRKQLARETALPVRKELVQVVGDVYRYLLASVSNTGEMGTIINWEQHILPGLLERPGEALAKVLGEPLPADAMPASAYTGPARMFVPEARTSVAVGEPLNLKVIVLAPRTPSGGTLYWRPMGTGDYTQMPLMHVARGVWSVQIPPEATQAESYEYYIEVLTQKGEELHWPATAPRLNQTVVVAPAGL